MADSRWLLAAAAATLAGCGGAESEFVLDYTAAYCDYYLQCADPALQVFDGLDTLEECEAVYGPPLELQSESCKLEKSAARACMDQMSALGCPADGAAIEEAVPAACGAVWKKCEPGATGATDAG